MSQKNKDSKIIIVKSCGECQFSFESKFSFCNLDSKVEVWPTIGKVHENCPLKKESITIKLEINE